MLKLWNITGHLNTVPSATSVIEQKDICPTDGRRLLSISCFPSVILPEENVFSQETLMALQRSSFFFLFLDFNFSKWRNCSVKGLFYILRGANALCCGPRAHQTRARYTGMILKQQAPLTRFFLGWELITFDWNKIKGRLRAQNDAQKK